MKNIVFTLFLFSFFSISPIYADVAGITTTSYSAVPSATRLDFLSADALDKEIVRQLANLANSVNGGSSKALFNYRNKGFWGHSFKRKDYKGKVKDAGIVLAKDNLVIIAFRGKNSKKDGRSGIVSSKIDILRLGMEGKVHRRFMESLLSVWQQIKPPIISYAKRNNINQKSLEFIVIGYGVGGAVASLAALRINDDSSLVMHPRNNTRKNQVKLLTFGAPAVLVGSAVRQAKAIMGAHNVIRFAFEGDVMADKTSKRGFSHFETLLKMRVPSGTKRLKKGGYDPKIYSSSAYAKSAPSAFSSKFNPSSQAVEGNLRLKALFFK